MKSIREEYNGVRLLFDALAVFVMAVSACAGDLATNASQGASAAPANTANTSAAAAVTGVVAEPANQTQPLPRLVDLGAGKCIPCKMMAPILEDLKTTYAGKLEVVFIDVWQKPEEGTKYGIETIPTQIFYDATGQERFRHVGFFSKEDILAKWKELGVALPASETPEKNER